MKNSVMRFQYLKVWGVVIAIAALVTSGCGSPEFVDAEGVITLDGAPLSGAMVIFQSPDMPLATAKTNENGHYRVETGSIEGIKPGEYVVTVAAYQARNNSEDRVPNLAIPRKFLQPESSGLKVVIVNGANRHINFELTTN